MSAPSLATRVGNMVSLLTMPYRFYEQADAGAPLMPSDLPEKAVRVLKAACDRVDELERQVVVQQAALDLEPDRAKAAAGELGGPPRYIVVALVDRIQRQEAEIRALNSSIDAQVNHVHKL